MTPVWRAAFTDDELNALHAEAFQHPRYAEAWWAKVNAHSLGWLCARSENALVGFVNVAWDGGIHAFVLDPVVAPVVRHRGLGVRLIEGAVAGARAAGCEWLHVDFDDHLRPFYFGACGFTPTDAGLIRLR